MASNPRRTPAKKPRRVSCLRMSDLFLALLLVLTAMVLIVGLTPAPLCAEEQSDASTPAEDDVALVAQGSDEDDIALTAQAANISQILDGDQFVGEVHLTQSQSSDGLRFDIHDSGKLVIDSGVTLTLGWNACATMNHSASIEVASGGRLVLEATEDNNKQIEILGTSLGVVVKDGGEMRMNSGSKINTAGNSTGITVENGGKVVIDGGWINVAEQSRGIVVQAGGELTMPKADLTFYAAGDFVRGLTLEAGATATLDGASDVHTLNLTGDNNACAIHVGKNATLNIEGTTRIHDLHNASRRPDSGVVVCAGGTINIGDGVSFANNAGSGYSQEVANSTQYSLGGGAIYAYDGSTLNVGAATFEGNATNVGDGHEGYGGAICAFDSTVVIDGATFKNNRATSRGGAVAGINSQVTIQSNALFEGNEALGAYYADRCTIPGAGGAVYIDAERNADAQHMAHLLVDGATFRGNKAQNAGGAIAIGGEHDYWGSDSHDGYIPGAVTAELRAALIEGNEVTAAITDAGGGGIYVGDDGSLVLHDLLVTGNAAEGVGGGVYTCGAGVSAQLDTAGSAVFDNTADLGKDILLAHKKALQVPGHEIQDHAVKGFMLGGGSHSFNNGGKGEDVEKLFRIDYWCPQVAGQDPAASYEPPEVGVSYEARPSDDAKTKAEQKATVIVRNNESHIETGSGSIPILGYDHASQTGEDGGYCITRGNGGGITNNGQMTIEGNVGRLEVEKRLEGKGTDSSKEFEFTVTLDNPDVDGTVNPDTGAAYGEGVEFKKGVATFTLKGGTSKQLGELPAGVAYRVAEKDYTKDDYTTTVPNNAEGTIDKDVTSVVPFVNEKHTYDPVSVVIEATKTLEGRQLEAGEFSFRLDDAQGQTIQTKTNDTNGIVLFDALSFEHEGTYTYTVREVAGDDESLVYDSSIHMVEIRVAAGTNGKLAATTTIAVDGQEADALSFDNVVRNAPTYEPVSVVLEATKTLEGRVIGDGEFSFRLDDAHGRTIQAKTNDANGIIVFDALSFEHEGTYTYEVHEVPGEGESVLYDTAVHVVTIQVAQVDGALVADVAYTRDGETVDAMSFDNVVEGVPEYSPLSISLEATKTLEGRTLKDGEFSFRLDDAHGETTQTKTNDAQGAVQFDAVSVRKPGTYVWVIDEVVGDAEDVTYDRRAYAATAKVDAGDDGALTLRSLAYTLDGEAAEKVAFVNKVQGTKQTTPGQPGQPGQQPRQPGKPGQSGQSTQQSARTSTPSTGDATLPAGTLLVAGILLAATGVLAKDR